MQLLNGNLSKGSYLFETTDSEELYERNLQLQSEDWIWRKHSITYDVNEQGYRCPDWNNCDWNNSILIFGCSFVFGTGIRNDQTVAFNLASLTKTPVINLGMSASSPTFQWVNTTLLAEQQINPTAAIYLWPQATRNIEFDSEHNVTNHLVFDNSRLLMSWVKNECNVRHLLDLQMQSVNHIWGTTPCLHYSLNKDATYTQLAVIDHGRDIQKAGIGHPGPRSNRQWAKIIYTDLKKLNILTS